MTKTISYNKFIKKIIFTTTIVIALVFTIYGYFIQSNSIKHNLKNETSLFVDLIFQNLYTAMQKGSNVEELNELIKQIESNFNNSSIKINRTIDDTNEENIKHVFETKKLSYFFKEVI